MLLFGQNADMAVAGERCIMAK